MRKVRTPDQVVDVDLVAQLDSDAIKLETPQTMRANVLARQTRERLEAEKPLRPAIVAVVADIGRLQEKRNPADLVLCKKDTQTRKTVEKTREHPLCGSNGTAAARGPEPAHLFHNPVNDLVRQLMRVIGKLKQGGLALAGAIEVHMD